MHWIEHHRRERLLVTGAWLARLRWVAVVGQVATITVVALVHEIPLPLAPLACLIGLTVVTNLWLTTATRSNALNRSSGHRWLAAMMLLDIISLTAMLYFTGGPNNPFILFYFANLALSAVALPARWTWFLAAVAAVCCVGLFAFHQPLPPLGTLAFAGRRPAELPIHQQGLIVALTTCVGVVVYFITRATGELQRMDAELQDAREKRARGEKLEALATLAAGAGHELATPLSTIAVAAKELMHQLQHADVDDSTQEDVRLIRDEVAQCRKILARMSVGAGQAAGEEVVRVTGQMLVDRTLSEFAHTDRLQLKISETAAAVPLDLQLDVTAQALRGVLQNACDASSGPRSVQVAVTSAPPWLQITVTDRGCGMSEEVLARAGEPFFTTKEPGQGMGLGLFLTRSVVERMGGTLEIDSRLTERTTVTLRLPSQLCENAPGA